MSIRPGRPYRARRPALLSVKIQVSRLKIRLGTEHRPLSAVWCVKPRPRIIPQSGQQERKRIMTRFTSLATVSAAALLVSGSMAFAQCVDTETTASTNGATASDPASPDAAKRMEDVAKDGSKAPMEAAPDSTQQQAQSGTTTRSSENGDAQQTARAT